MSRLSTRVVPAYAKLNLSLEVVARRADGWHDIDSVLVPIDWHDLVGLSLEPADTDSQSLTVDGPAAAGVPEGDSNLTASSRASAPRTRRSSARDPGLAVQERSRTGRASAAARRMPRRSFAPGSPGSRTSASPPTRIGSLRLPLVSAATCPRSSRCTAQRVRGRGERLETVRTPRLHLAIASTTPSSTADTYAAVAPAEIGDDGRSARLAGLLDAGQTPDTSLMGSALEAGRVPVNAALAEALQRARRVGEGVDWFLTGSGGAVFAVTTDHAAAERLAEAMREAGYTARACRTVG